MLRCRRSRRSAGAFSAEPDEVIPPGPCGRSCRPSRRSTSVVPAWWEAATGVVRWRSSIMAEGLARHGEVHRLGTQGLVLAERVANPGVGKHQAAQIRVPLEADAEQVE